MIIGVTGSIGSGKSQVVRYWSRVRGMARLDLDQVARELLEPGRRGWKAMKQDFGDRFLRQNGRIDRAALRQALFGSAGIRNRVEALLHPLIRQEMRRFCGQVSGNVLVEIPLLFEAGWQLEVERIVVVYADTGVRLRRILARDGVEPEEIQNIFRAQLPWAEKIQGADHVLDNSGCWALTCLQVRHLARVVG